MDIKQRIKSIMPEPVVAFGREGKSMSFKQVVKSLTPAPLLEARRSFLEGLAYRRYVSMDPGEYREALSQMYRETLGVNPDLDNPKRLTEKIQWLKLWDSTEEKGELADKYRVRQFVAERAGEECLVPLVWDDEWFDVGRIPVDDLPKACVLKLTTGSGFNYFVKEGERPTSRQLRRFFRKPMSRDFSMANGFELHYSFIRPGIIVEQYLSNGESLADYRFWCSWGRVFSLWVDTGSWNHNYRRTVFDMSLKVVDVRATHMRHEVAIDLPDCIDKMMSIASSLSRDFALARVDLYERAGTILFGEITFTPQSGFMTFDDANFDYWMGSQVILPKEKKPFKGRML